ncbi:type III PLP-dependent enzyme [Alkalimonas delamerensis]|uniref:Type III PLP-dependent enzyme n=1 Tax=Alkalimonas delamerensis TaxID=265981 RepID=A0ABT9GTL4_9GAMM|nr:type III PLP-dependent enzyme [Alkalimonas delamerensis]MDP4530125.1 type III PLP-dependent enzyme [Alkalimonas delamerensis]
MQHNTHTPVDYRDLVARHGSPLLVLDGDAVRQQYRALTAALPGVELHYALKPLPHPAVVAILQQEGGRFDLATNGEVDLVREQGVNPQHCIHSHPIKRDSDIRYALEFGCTVFVVDNPVELAKFVPYADQTQLLLRLSFPNPDTKVDLSKKFGCRPEQALGLLQQAKALGLNVMGLSFHVGSQAVSPKRHVAAIEQCLQVFQQAEAAGLPLHWLDIGGGFPVSYLDQVSPIEQYCAPIRQALAKFPAAVRLMAEPGRFISAPAMTSVASVMGVAERGDQCWYYLDDGVYGAYSGQIFDHTIYPLAVPYNEGPTVNSVLAGPTCDSIDVIRENIQLPRLAVGDLVIGRMMGAYTWASATEFNFFRKAEILVLNGAEPCRLAVVA